MRRNKKFGIYSNNTIKRCYDQHCCKRDINDLMFKSCYLSEERKFALIPKSKERALSDIRHHFVGKNYVGHKKVSFNYVAHRGNLRKDRNYNNVKSRDEIKKSCCKIEMEELGQYLIHCNHY